MVLLGLRFARSEKIMVIGEDKIKELVINQTCYK